MCNPHALAGLKAGWKWRFCLGCGAWAACGPDGRCCRCFDRATIHGAGSSQKTDNARAARTRSRRPDICVHCKQKKCSRPRGLCHGCYYTPGLTEKYPPVDPARAGRRGELGLVQPLVGPAFPTDALPGTEAKVCVLEARAAMHCELWHPRDNSGDFEERRSAC